MRILCCFAAALSFLMLLSACGGRSSGPVPPPEKTSGSLKPYRVGSVWYYPKAHAEGFRQRGLASWYGKPFHGRKTSSGEVYNMYAMTAAHKTLPIGTRVRVKHLKNHREVEVRINDRGPFVRGRIIDLSYTAAKRLGIFAAGTGPVEIAAVGSGGPATGVRTGGDAPADYYQGNFTVQVGAFQNPQNARRLQEKLSKKYQNAHITIFRQGDQTFYRVRVGSSRDLNKALEYEAYLIRQGFSEAMVVAED